MSSGGLAALIRSTATFDVKTCTKTLQVCGQTPANRIARHRMSAIASPPPASITATSTSTRPRSCRGTNPRRASALQTSPVNPVRSACRRRPTLPAWATTPAPSPVTDKPADHEVRFTYGVPASRDFSERRKSKNPMQDRHFRVSTR